MGEPGDPYATVEELKIRLGIDDVFDDFVLEGALLAASREIENYCSRQFNDFGVSTARVYYPTNIWCVEFDDAIAGTSIIVATDNAGDGTYSTVWDFNELQFLPLNTVVSGSLDFPFNRVQAVGSRLFIFPQLWWNNRRAPVQITAQWGWLAIPSPVNQATLILAEAMAKMKDAPFGVAGFSEFGAVRVRDNPIVKNLLRPYRADGGVLVG